jgi:hypothetical protein
MTSKEIIMFTADCLRVQALFAAHRDHLRQIYGQQFETPPAAQTCRSGPGSRIATLAHMLHNRLKASPFKRRKEAIR